MNRVPHVLIVDDDLEIRRLVGRFLTENGMRATAVRDTREADTAIEAGRVDLVVLDLMLPGEDGLAYARRLRKRVATPILMLTARGDDIDRIAGLEIGADDYLGKPFNPRELLARIRSVLRRTGEAKPGAGGARRRRFAGWSIDFIRRELRRPDGAMVPMTDTEFDLLCAFVDNPQRVLSRDQLLDMLRGREAQLFDRSIDVAVMRLRRKIEVNPAQPALIKTIRNGGYILTAEVDGEE
ncbi:MAG: response regulator [Alphaproteobacteria bacterium]|nr:response regulator [Alphaproteobacteria bacterium]